MGRPPALRSGAFAALLMKGRKKGSAPEGGNKEWRSSREQNPNHMVQSS